MHGQKRHFSAAAGYLLVAKTADEHRSASKRSRYAAGRDQKQSKQKDDWTTATVRQNNLKGDDMSNHYRAP